MKACACPRTHSPPYPVACHQVGRHEWRRRPSRSHQHAAEGWAKLSPFRAPGQAGCVYLPPSAAGSADCRQPSAAWTLQTPALRSRGWGCSHLLLTLRSVGAVSCPGQMGFPPAKIPVPFGLAGSSHRATTHRTCAPRVFARFTDLFGYRRPPPPLLEPCRR